MKQGTLIANRYRLINKLGQGGMGAVWRVYDRLEKQEVALKQVAKALSDIRLSTSDAIGRKKAALIQEFSLLASLRHPNIISVLDYGIADGKPFFTMELVNQPRTIIEVAQQKNPTEQIDYIIKILQALRYLHRRGVLHRDLKPDNVLVFDNDEVKVLDFGLSIESEFAEGRVGTMAYMSPESIKDNRTTAQSDLYAVGVMAYEMIAGERPFHPHDMRGILKRPADTTLLGNHPATWVIERLLLKDPQDRYVDADTCIRAFQQAMNLSTEAESITVRESYLQASTFVGRDEEFQTLVTALGEVLDGQTAFYLVGGESGVGKSRLMNELRIQALVSGATVLRGQAVEGGGLPFQLWRNIVQRLVLMVEVTDIQAGILLDIVPDITDLIGRPVEKAPKLTGTAYQDRLVLTIIDLLRAVHQPIVLILEDLQWTIESLAVLKQCLLVRDQFRQLMIVANYRNEEAPNLPDELMGIHIMRLDRLNRGAMEKLTISMLGQQHANEQVVDLLQKETEGNLFFLVETVRALAEEAGGLDLIGTTTLPDGVFTGGMQQLTLRRLNKVAEQYQPIQQLASVIGREIDVNLLTYTFERSQVNQWLMQASEASVIDIQENTWRFSHDKLRETVIAHIPENDKPTLHQTAAESIEAVYPNQSSYHEALLRHWKVAGHLEKELIYAIEVGNYYKQMSYFDKTEPIFREANEKIAQYTGSRFRELKRNILHSLGYTMVYRGDYGIARQYYDEAMTLINADEATEEYLDLITSYILLLQIEGDLEQIQKLGATAYNTVKHYDHDPAIHLKTIELLSDVSYGSQDFEQTRRYLLDILRLADNAPNPTYLRANVYNQLGAIATFDGNLREALRHFTQAIHYAKQVQNHADVVNSSQNKAFCSILLGDFVEAHDTIADSLEHMQRMGNGHYTIDAIMLAGLYLDYKGESIRGLSWLHFGMNHPWCKKESAETFKSFYENIIDRLSEQDTQVAIDRSEELDLDTIVQDLLTEFDNTN